MVRYREKACAVCQLSASTLFRVQLDRSQQWYFVCQECGQSADPTYYRYGGTWQAKKRR
jgi:hypothetical protein